MYELEVQKLAWFLQRSVRALATTDPLRLKFVANKYGPYSDQLRHLLDAMDGSYLHSDKRLSEAGPLDPIHFADERRERLQSFLDTEAREYEPVLEAAARFIDGFRVPPRHGASCHCRLAGHPRGL